MAWFNDEGWSSFVRMSKAVHDKWWERLPKTGSGVYRLIALLDDESLNPAALNRICGVDATGTLYVGAAKNSISNRIGSLVITHDPLYKGLPHKVLPERLAEKFPPGKLAMSWKLVDEPWSYEAQLLNAYENVFGELPPRNSQKPPVPVASFGGA